MSEVELFDALRYHVEVDSYGTRRYYNSANRLHRESGPAVEYKDGEKRWYRNGLLHRIEGPAVEWADGTKLWYQNGQLHRTDGPAVECRDGDKRWYINGERLTEAEFNQLVSEMSEQAVYLIH